MIVALFGIIAIASGDTISGIFREMGNSIHQLLESGPKEYGNITLYKSDETSTYSSIEELTDSEGIEILYPSWLPENEKIIGVWHFIEDASEVYLMQSDVPNHSIRIKVNCELTETLKLNCTEKEIAGFLVYYKKYPEYTQANFVYNNDCYAIKANTEDNLFRIIENLKEIN